MTPNRRERPNREKVADDSCKLALQRGRYTEGKSLLGECSCEPYRLMKQGPMRSERLGSNKKMCDRATVSGRKGERGSARSLTA